jgi:hypothetical protein
MARCFRIIASMLKLPAVQDESASTIHELQLEQRVSSSLTNVVSRQFSHPDVRSFLQPQSNFEYVFHPALGI